MKGDISRDTFDPALHFSSVRLQQGRVVTDADWNEQADLTRHRAERQALDIIGDCGAPMHAAGFELAVGTYALGVFIDSGSPGAAWVVAEDGVLLVTHDGGASWEVLDAKTTAHLRAVRFAGRSGWAVGDGGTIRSTINGVDWNVEDAGVTANLRGLSVLSVSTAIHICAVGDNGVVVRSSDSGEIWSTDTAGTTRLNAVHFVDAEFGIAVGQEGEIVRTTDGGETWTKVQSNTVAHLRALAFVDATNGWIVGDSGTVLKIETNDGGATWTTQSIPSTTTENLRAIAFRNAEEGLAVGDEGLVLQITDGGARWLQVDSGTAASLRGVSLASGQTGWAVGDASVAIRFDSGSPGTVVETLPGISLSIMPGRFYAHGVLCELEARASYYNQPDRGRPPRLAAGTHLVYLDVWQRHLSYLEAPDIREVALGGPDTATRAKTVWQVKALELPPASPNLWNCASDVVDWDALIAPSAARLRARAEPQAATSGVCEIAATAGFRRLENQLYRVEVHEGGAQPTFKWSRENASVAYKLESITPDAINNETVVRLATRGPDDNLDLATGDWVEILDDDVALEQRIGVLFEYDRDGDDAKEIVLSGLVSGTIGRDPTRHPLLRRWEQKPLGAATALAIEEGKWLALEEGAEVWFEPGGSYRPGDYWLIPARTITGDVEWPRDDDGEPEARPPAGIEDCYCRLAIVEVSSDGSITTASDCRNLFPPITALDQLLYVSGDGQDGVPGPDKELPQPLIVRVARGKHPVKDARVRFRIDVGKGSLSGPPGGLGTLVGSPGIVLDVDTNADGMAGCSWTLDADPRASERYQRVRASLLDAAEQPIDGRVIVFCATATVSLQYVSGDGQLGQAGQALAHQLEVRVANGQRAVAGARVQFRIESGNGQLTGPSLVTTVADGMARIRWQLGASGAQRVVAELVDTKNAVIQYLGFNAAFQPQAGQGGGCAITIGTLGQVPQLTSETLNKLLDRGNGNVCLCFLPEKEKHIVDKLEVDLDKRRADGEVKYAGRISIHGCGHASVVGLRTVANLKGFSSIELYDLSFDGDENTGFEFKKCSEVRVSGIDATTKAADKVPFLRFSDVLGITVSGCVIKTPFPGLAVVFDDALAVTHVTDNQIEGVVSFYGTPGPAPNLLIAQLAQRLDALGVRVDSGPGRLFISGNSLGLLTIGSEKVREIREFADGAPALSNLFAAASIDGNAILEPRNLFVSKGLTLNCCSWLATPTQDTSLGTFVAEGAAVTGNFAAAGIDRAFPLIVVTRSARFTQAGNLVFLRNQ